MPRPAHRTRAGGPSAGSLHPTPTETRGRAAGGRELRAPTGAAPAGTAVVPTDTLNPLQRSYVCRGGGRPESRTCARLSTGGRPGLRENPNVLGYVQRGRARLWLGLAPRPRSFSRVSGAVCTGCQAEGQCGHRQVHVAGFMLSWTPPAHLELSVHEETVRTPATAARAQGDPGPGRSRRREAEPLWALVSAGREQGQREETPGVREGRAGPPGSEALWGSAWGP